MPTERAQARRGVVADERGAVLIVGLFAAVFLTGLLYLVFGVGETLRHRERMNDAVDAAAYSTGVMHARAMNLVALANMVKLTVAAVMAAYLAIATGAAAAIAWILSGRWRRIRYGWVIPALVVVSVQATVAYAGFRSDASTLARAADSLQQTLRDDLPTVALLHADALVRANYAPPATGVVSAPQLTFQLPPMPIRAGNTWDLCQRAFPYTAAMIQRASRSVPSSRPRSRFRRAALASAPAYCMVEASRPYEMSARRLGTEPFQIRLAVLGEGVPTLGERGVLVATRDGGAPSRSSAIRDLVSVVAFAQSEYYFDGSAGAHEWTWRMQWRARMRRFRPEGGYGGMRPLLGPFFSEVYR